VATAVFSLRGRIVFPLAIRRSGFDRASAQKEHLFVSFCLTFYLDSWVPQRYRTTGELDQSLTGTDGFVRISLLENH
jgi:hypothetical protein